MHAVSTNQFADILHFNDNWYETKGHGIFAYNDI